MYSKLTNKLKFVIIVCITAFYILGFYLNTLNSKELGELEVVVKIKITKDDFLQFFYLEDKMQKFDVKKSIKKQVQGKDGYQEVRFKFSHINDLNGLRLDIGSNLNQDTIRIEHIKFIKENETLFFDIDKFKNLFKPNIYIKVGKDKNAFVGKTVYINSKKIHDPYFVSANNSKEFKQIKSGKLIKYPFLTSGFILTVLFFTVIFNLERITISSQNIFIISFLLILILPTIQKTLTVVKPLKSSEKRKLVERPDFSFSKKFARSYEAYYSDNFGLRNHLVDFGGTYRARIFGSSMHPELVNFGKENWLFYNRIDGKIYKSYTNTNLLSQERLKKIVNKWENNKKNYEAIGAKYFLTFWPNKHTIYPEYLPYGMKVQIKDTISRVDQILQYLNGHDTNIKLFDPRPHLLKAKKDNLLYHKFDTHWNNYGAFIAYRNFFISNYQDLNILPKNINDFEVIWDDHNQGELIQMLGVNNASFFKEKAPTFILRKDKDQIEFLSVESYPKQTIRTRNKYCGNKLRVLVFRDSFTTKLIQFFSLHFYEVTYIWGHSEKYVKKLKPDIIIEGYVERATAEKVQ